MKNICKFNLEKQIEVEEIKVTKDADNKEVKTIVKVNKPEVHSYFLRTPNREIKENQELFVAEIMAECDRRGIARRVARQKNILDSGDVLSKEERILYDKARESLWEKQSEYPSLNDNKNKTPEETEKLTKLTDELFDILNEIQGFESRMDSELFQFSAESIAQNRLQLFLLLMLSYEEKDGKDLEVFGKGDYKNKLVKFDEMNDSDDPFINKIIEYFSLVVSLHILGKAETQKDFDLAIKYWENRNLVQAVETLKSDENSAQTIPPTAPETPPKETEKEEKIKDNPPEVKDNLSETKV